jgi:hypothetical protein
MLLQCGFALPFLWSQVLNPLPGRSHSRAIYVGADRVWSDTQAERDGRE